jgi:hypothetical protein
MAGGRGRPRPGTQAGTLTVNGYIQIVIDCELYLAHRLAVFYTTGYWPINTDHADKVKTNNVYSNIRSCDWAHNRHNVGPPKTNTSGLKGLRFVERYGKWHAQLQAHNRKYHLGYWEHLEDAIAAYAQGLMTFHRDYARVA